MPRWGQVEHKPGATSSTSVEPPQRAHSPQATSCRKDGKYPAALDAILADTGIKVVLSGVQMPRMNAIMERWIQSCRHELLDRMLVWHQAHLLHALHQYERHYNAHRPHRGISNARPLYPLPEPISNPDTITHLNIRRRDRIGGIIHEYEHGA
jgi:transposase InsO family protein